MLMYLSGKQMNESSSIISEWLLGKSKQQRAEVLHANSGQAESSLNMPIEGVLEQFAARILLACADDLGLSTMELSSLLQEPRKDALACLITVIRDDD